MKLSEISNAYVGNTPIKKIYMGGVEVWSRSNIPKDYILRYDFNGSISDLSSNSNHGEQIGSLPFVAGRKTETQAIQFGSGCVKTTNAVAFNSDKLTISFWMKTTQTSLGMLIEVDTNALSANSFYIDINEFGPMVFKDNQSSMQNTRITNENVRNNAWHHILITSDRSLGVNQSKIFINGVENSYQHSSNTGDLSGNYPSFNIFIGARDGSSFMYSGLMQDLRIYNRVLTPSEIEELYNE